MSNRHSTASDLETRLAQLLLALVFGGFYGLTLNLVLALSCGGIARLPLGLRHAVLPRAPLLRRLSVDTGTGLESARALAEPPRGLPDCGEPTSLTSKLCPLGLSALDARSELDKTWFSGFRDRLALVRALDCSLAQLRGEEPDGVYKRNDGYIRTVTADAFELLGAHAATCDLIHMPHAIAALLGAGSFLTLTAKAPAAAFPIAVRGPVLAANRA